MQAARRRSEGYHADAGPTDSTIRVHLHRHQGTARVTSARVFTALATRADLPKAQLNTRVTIGLGTLLLVRHRQRQLQLDIRRRAILRLSPAGHEDPATERGTGRQADGLDEVGECYVVTEAQQRDVVELIAGQRSIPLMGDLLFDTHGDGRVGAHHGVFIVRQAIPLGIGVVFAEANAGQAPTGRQILALNAVRGRENVASADQNAAARRRSTVGCKTSIRIL